MLTVLKTNDRALAERLRKMDDVVDELYTAVKLYLTQISREALDENEGRRWADIVSFTINMEQVGDIIERILTDLEDKKIDKRRSFSDAGMAEICDLHARLSPTCGSACRVFLNGDLKSAQELLAQKVLFRDLERAYADSHLGRLAGNTLESIETSSLHLDLISDLQAHQLAHLLDRLPDPRAGRRARAHAAQGAGRRRRADDDPRSRRRAAARRRRPTWPKPKPRTRLTRATAHGPFDLRHLHPLRPQGRPRSTTASRSRSSSTRCRRRRAPRTPAPRRRWSPRRCCTTSATC